jgi:protein-L-isoaspartate(D-aspartate) O-methyltransferase
MTKDELIEDLIRAGYLRTPRIIEAFRTVARADFVPRQYANVAYENIPMPIGFGQTISQPLTVAFMLEELAPAAGERVLEIGAGSGWQSALLAHLVGPTGRVVAVERLPELYDRARRNIGGYRFLDAGTVELVLGDGSREVEERLRPAWGFDKIIAAASAEVLPEAWKRELKVGGRIVAPVRQAILRFDKTSPVTFKISTYPGFAFVPLIEENARD